MVRSSENSVDEDPRAEGLLGETATRSFGWSVDEGGLHARASPVRSPHATSVSILPTTLSTFSLLTSESLAILKATDISLVGVSPINFVTSSFNPSHSPTSRGRFALRLLIPSPSAESILRPQPSPSSPHTRMDTVKNLGKRVWVVLLLIGN